MLAYNSTRQLILCQNVCVADTFVKRLLGATKEIAHAPRRTTSPENWVIFKGDFGNSYDGILIRPCRSIHTFFLKYPLDVIFLDQNKHICRIYSHLKPFRITPLIPSAQMVLELMGGTLLPSMAQKGDIVIFLDREPDRS
ncbi:uncharacterized protein HKBW3S42_00525 [Candidatus Hakubella thermalkaliphila]|uniref:DUF192 domain-containing protein n=1 Tax=Candidatus Hakubella thermalkaliphila TaxID=2754717 RepID=A0A6V8PJB3_9ACTN|nr:uncharacterized protein HKBW3S42_00525 [Candidatus Hakubella thermalkaliphila]